MFRKACLIICLPILLITVSACQSLSPLDHVTNTGQSQVQLRALQSRAFDTNDKGFVMRSLVSTLQDLGFVLDKADDSLGVLTATKVDGYELRLTATVRPHLGGSKMLVRVNLQEGRRVVLEPELYRDFFNSLSKAMFLEAHIVE